MGEERRPTYGLAATSAWLTAAVSASLFLKGSGNRLVGAAVLVGSAVLAVHFTRQYWINRPGGRRSGSVTDWVAGHPVRASLVVLVVVGGLLLALVPVTR
jgi:hypothetical protein